MKWVAPANASLMILIGLSKSFGLSGGSRVVERRKLTKVNHHSVVVKVEEERYIRFGVVLGPETGAVQVESIEVLEGYVEP